MSHRFIVMVFASTVFAVSDACSQAQCNQPGCVLSGAIGVRADSLLTALSATGFSGVALVAKDRNVVLKKGYGLANRAMRIPMTAGTVVQIGSNTKDFTITAILQLVERGRLSLSDPITKFFRDVPRDKKGITIDYLLNHRAGFDQHMGPDFEVVTRDQEIARAMAAKLLFEAGTDRKYSNIGYSLLAAIIEMVSAVSYDQYVKQNILDPIGLRETGLLLPRFDTARVAHGYRQGQDAGTFLQRPLAPDGPYWNLRGNGGMLSTVGDMYRFYEVLMSPNPAPLLKADTRDLFFHPDRPAVLAGSDLTWFFFYSRYPGAKLEFFLVSNSNEYPAPKARQQLASVLGIEDPPGEGGTPPRRAVIDTGAPGSVSFPETPAGRAARNFVDVHNGNSVDSITRFLEQNVVQRPDDKRTIEQRIAGFRAMRADLGVLTPVEILSADASQITFRARSANQGTVIYGITVEDRTPFRIVGIKVEGQ